MLANLVCDTEYYRDLIREWLYLEGLDDGESAGYHPKSFLSFFRNELRSEGSQQCLDYKRIFLFNFCIINMQTDCQPTVIATTPLKKHEYSREWSLSNLWGTV